MRYMCCVLANGWRPEKSLYVALHSITLHVNVRFCSFVRLFHSCFVLFFFLAFLLCFHFLISPIHSLTTLLEFNFDFCSFYRSFPYLWLCGCYFIFLATYMLDSLASVIHRNTKSLSLLRYQKCYQVCITCSILLNHYIFIPLTLWYSYFTIRQIHILSSWFFIYCCDLRSHPFHFKLF